MIPRVQPLGPLMLDVGGTALTDADRARLTHPLCGGVIIFARNYESPEQVAALTAQIHALRTPPLLVAVDQEGGRVQRFREGFTPIPPMRALGLLHDEHPHQATRLAESIGRVIGEELRACGVDFSFTPVLDVDHGPSTVIGNRAFHADPAVDHGARTGADARSAGRPAWRRLASTFPVTASLPPTLTAKCRWTSAASRRSKPATCKPFARLVD